MKIQSLTGLVGYSGYIREKRDGDSPHRDHSQQDQSKHENESSQEEELSPEAVDQAIEAFQADAKTNASGLNISVEGNGPGLKVVLKDQAGGVVRSFSGEEFVRLRQETSRDGRIRGKILDQKL